ncbi:hypothetical protein N1207_11005 [Bacillus subtilis]|uniref:hypothetical protein n=1 Tax=Bacillus subtilis TaxID=1423 RepID=UPI0013F63D89|nr:hypothetical protein [Bacillus subtilis]MCS4324025.1 hypothetical protein [Bacillus subtilis]NQE96800.1 hypothetical protein [Bacillus subtilis]UWS55261.1 hypothetical protein N1207_11005 [Bacillus subtilis]WBU32450.1 hypothetical protein OSK17_10915 [Bacillus subtilis]
MTEKDLIEKYNLQNCTVTYSNEPNMELMTKAFMDYQSKIYYEKKKGEHKYL